MEVVLLRPWASATTMGRLLAPGVALTATTAEKENVPSPAVGSPLLPSSKKGWVAGPPIALKSPLTVIPVLAGPLPGGTTTPTRAGPPRAPEARGALPAPPGLAFAPPCPALGA